jgi:microcystin-dependent protein
MATAYTSNKKIGALDSASTPLAAANELVINQNGDILKTPLSAVEAKIFDAKTATTTPTGTEVVVVRQTNNTLRQVALADIVPALNITNAKISNSAAIADSKLATINTAGKVTNTAVQAVATNTANRIVTRDGSGNFEAGIITATLAGNATTASSVADGSVTLAKLVAAVQQALVPAGAVQPFAMNSAPSGWLAADGAAVSRTDYAALFSAISTTYGAGDGSTTFNLPDLRGYFVRGSGTNSDGSASGTFGAKQGGSIINHTHSGTTSTESADHTHTFNVTSGGESVQHGHSMPAVVTSANTGSGAGIVTGGNGYFLSGGGAISTSLNGNSHAHNVSGTTSGRSAAHTHTLTTGNPSVGGASETRPANIAMLYCIKF